MDENRTMNKEKEQLEVLLLEGLVSGPGREVTREFWKELRAELLDRHRKAGCHRTRGVEDG